MKTAQNNYFDTPTLKFLVGAGKAGGLVASGTEGGFVLLIREAGSESLLKAQRGGPRLFSRLDTVARYLKDVGISDFAVELSHWDDA
jgi:hypothetical protein